MKKLNTAEFILRAQEIHGDLYDYSQTRYLNKRTKVKILCKNHGSFLQIPESHVFGHGCPKCGTSRIGDFHRHTTENFINNARQVHGPKYDYTPTIYTASSKKVVICCPQHGSFTQTAADHTTGKGCPKCGAEQRSYSNRLTTKDFIERSQGAHGRRYNYSKVRYINSSRKVEIICPKHGSFWQTPSSHLSNRGCPGCGSTRTKESLQRAALKFIAKAKVVHANKYGYDTTIYKRTSTKVSITCPIHGNFLQKPCDHLGGHGCPVCSESQGEKAVATLLASRGIGFERQYKFNNCRGKKRPLPFDFAVFNEDGSLKCLIEYQGIQHYKPISAFGGERYLLEVMTTDLIKRRFCDNNNMPLLEIKYDEGIGSKINEFI